MTTAKASVIYQKWKKKKNLLEKKVKKLIETSTENKKKFFCNSDSKKRVEKQRFLASNHKGQVLNQIRFQG